MERAEPQQATRVDARKQALLEARFFNPRGGEVEVESDPSQPQEPPLVLTSNSNPIPSIPSSFPSFCLPEVSRTQPVPVNSVVTTYAPLPMTLPTGSPRPGVPSPARPLSLQTTQQPRALPPMPPSPGVKEPNKRNRKNCLYF